MDKDLEAILNLFEEEEGPMDINPLNLLYVTQWTLSKCSQYLKTHQPFAHIDITCLDDAKFIVNALSL